jgi:hypothetical protein
MPTLHSDMALAGLVVAIVGTMAVLAAGSRAAWPDRAPRE